MTWAPRALPMANAVTPTPELTPGMSIHSPAFKPPCTTSISNTTMEVSGMAAA